ncbi:hypothetical protein NECHADRAFT_45955 [Paecilomyces variotii No. 5]|uniref:Xylanolytic transcriptional activator regulatory domain-containing protein n=1 Tax=Byssochlamys spectabilis (strain No. 5 / NBRC 109023) TaxID=1356009 RepID=V5FK51_BYSSN|nr:hypothetical protein NECHADRAFT_45955 [Paecilomyces variotii No. 5]
MAPRELRKLSARRDKCHIRPHVRRDIAKQYDKPVLITDGGTFASKETRVNANGAGSSYPHDPPRDEFFPTGGQFRAEGQELPTILDSRNSQFVFRSYSCVAQILTDVPGLRAAVVYAAIEDANTLDVTIISTVPHLAGKAAANTLVRRKDLTQHSYSETLSASFSLPFQKDFHYNAETISHTRNLAFLKENIGGPFFGLEQIWEEHTYYEFENRSSEHTMKDRCFITYAPRGSRKRAREEAPRRAATSDTRSSTQEPPGLIGPANTINQHNAHAGVPDIVNEFCPLSPSDSRRDGDEGGSLSGHTETSATNPPRMLLNLRGERVYIGGAASISFLQIVRDWVTQQIGPTAFSRNEKSDTMLEIEQPQANMIDLEVNMMELNRERRYRYLRSYNIATEALIHIFDLTELETIIIPSRNNESLDSVSSLPPLKQASLYLVIAIGAQCESVSSAKEVGLAYFRHARRRAFAGFLEDPDLDMVRTFLLMAFYMLGQCRRNAAFMYLGIATKAAFALGLHNRDSYQKSPGPADLLKLRIWMSICIVDKVVNSLLGRPSSTIRISSDSVNSLVGIAQHGNHLDHITESLVAANNIASIINNITDTLYDQKKVTTSIVEQFLQDIEIWKQQLPKSMRYPPRTEAVNPGSLPLQHGAIASMHVSCFYYFAVILVSRPFLMSTLTTSQSNGVTNSQLAAACLDAAMYLSQTCMEGLRFGLLKGNMCIMKALIFAAGLVLGLEIFAKYPVDPNIETAFQGSQKVLKHFSMQSPQAEHYLEILTSLSSAIKKRHSKEASGGRSRYVSKIFSFDFSANTDGNSGDREDSNLPPVISNDNHLFSKGDDGAAQDWAFPQLEDSDLYLDWDVLNISQWDSFPFCS